MATKKAKEKETITEQPQQAEEELEINSHQDTSSEPEEQSLRFERSRNLAKTLWQATLGTAITLEQRGAKAFNRLVDKGAKFQGQNNQVKSTHTGENTSEKSAKLRAVDRIHDLENKIEHGLDRGRNNTLHWIGVPNREDFETLNQQLKVLTEKVEMLEKKNQSSADKEKK